MIKTNYKGLTEKEVQESRLKYGSNELNVKESQSFMASLWETFSTDPIIKILVVALIIQVVFFFFGHGHWYEPVGIALAVILATVVGTWSEYSSEKGFQELQAKASRIKCKVFRDGEIKEIFIGEIVVGDKILLQTGDKVPVDGIVIDGKLEINQAALNGETKLASKKVAPTNFNFSSNEHDEEDSPLLNPYKLFRDSVVSEGEAVVEALFVGNNTLMGKKDEDEGEEVESPLTHKLSVLAGNISKFGYIGATTIALAYMLSKVIHHTGDIGYFAMANLPQIGMDVVQAVILAVIIIVMAVPEGLPMMIAGVLAINMKKLLKDNILVRELIGIETAGSLNILFSDKTGTITKGELQVVTFTDATGKDYNSFKQMGGKIKKLLHLAITQNSSSVTEKCSKTGKLKVLGGNATERALLEYANTEDMKHNSEQIAKIDFNSRDKYSASQIKGELNTTLLKGAPEKIIESCTYYYNEDGKKEKLTKEMVTAINEKIDRLAERAIRVLAIATVDANIVEDSVDCKDSCLIGFVGIRDDLRDTSVESIKEMQKAGVQVVMITGDRKETAVAIAREAGLITDPTHIVLTSKELNEMSDEDVKAKMKHIRVIARALPKDKLRLVKLAQELNLVAGMTGDGVNDAPALERADVGFAMGSGTEVAKESSKIVILDDNFKSIARTCLYGRTIYNSIQKFIIFQLTVNVAAVAISFVGPFIGMDAPLSVTQILWLNLVMDTLAALAFGGEPALKKYMEAPPKDRSESIVSKYMWNAILINGGFITIMSVLFLKLPAIAEMFRIPMEMVNGIETPDLRYFMTGYFTFFIFLNIFNMLNARTTELNLFDHINENKGFLKVVGIIVTVQLIMTYFGGNILRAYGLTLTELALVIGLSFLIIPLDLIRKKLVIRK